LHNIRSIKLLLRTEPDLAVGRSETLQLIGGCNFG